MYAASLAEKRGPVRCDTFSYTVRIQHHANALDPASLKPLGTIED